MFCPDCGTQCDSKFCPSCGRNLQGVEIEKPAEKMIPPLSEPYYYERNGKTVDLHKVMRNFRNGWRKSGAYNYVMTELGISKEEARGILDPLYAVHTDEEFTFWASLGASFSMNWPLSFVKRVRLTFNCLWRASTERFTTRNCCSMSCAFSGVNMSVCCFKITS